MYWDTGGGMNVMCVYWYDFMWLSVCFYVENVQTVKMNLLLFYCGRTGFNIFYRTKLENTNSALSTFQQPAELQT